MGQYKCCCCIPLRAGVLVIALLSAAFYIASTVGFFLIKGDQDSLYGYLSTHTEIDRKGADAVLYTSIAVSIIFALTSLFGVIGSITQQRKMINIFKVSYWIVAVLSFLASIATIVSIRLQRTIIISACSEASPTYDCDSFYRNYLIIVCIVSMVISAIQFYFASAISSYATRLRRTNMHEKLRNLEDFPEPPHKTEFF